MLSASDLTLALKCAPDIHQDKNEPFPILYYGITVAREKTQSITFPNLILDPAASGASCIIEYAIYFDYDIQHLYELEHAWVAVDENEHVIDCWASFHGLRMHAAGPSKLFTMNGNHPVLYLQPGKHALMPDPDLFYLIPGVSDVCNKYAGGGVLTPPILRGKWTTDEEKNAKIRAYIRSHFSFTPSWEFEFTEVKESQYITGEELLELIPQLVEAQWRIIQEQSSL